MFNRALKLSLMSAVVSLMARTNDLLQAIYLLNNLILLTSILLYKPYYLRIYIIFFVVRIFEAIDLGLVLLHYGISRSRCKII